MMRFAASVPGMDQMCCADSLLLLVVINPGLQLVLYVSFYQYYRMEKAKMSLCIVIFCVCIFKNILVFNSRTKQYFFFGKNIVFSYSCHVKLFLFYAVCVPLLVLNAIT